MTRGKLALLLVAIALLVFPASALARFRYPCDFRGTVKLDGHNIPAGTMIWACVPRTGTCVSKPSFSYLGQSWYGILTVPGYDEEQPEAGGAVDGDIVVFRIGDIPADQTAIWQEDGDIVLNLTGTAVKKSYLPLILRQRTN